MEGNGPIDLLPLWALFIIILLVVLLSVKFGYRLGKYRRSRREEEKEAPLGTMVGATLGLFAFILAFTFGLAANRFDTRRQLLLDEANAIGTTYLRAGMLPERGQYRNCTVSQIGIELRIVRGAQRRGYSGYAAALVAKGNAKCARSADEIAVGTDDFQLTDGVTDFD